MGVVAPGEKKMFIVVIITVHTFKTYTRVEVKLHPFLLSELHGGAWWTARSGRFTLGK